MLTEILARQIPWTDTLVIVESLQDSSFANHLEEMVSMTQPTNDPNNNPESDEQSEPAQPVVQKPQPPAVSVPPTLQPPQYAPAPPSYTSAQPQFAPPQLPPTSDAGVPVAAPEQNQAAQYAHYAQPQPTPQPYGPTPTYSQPAYAPAYAPAPDGEKPGPGGAFDGAYDASDLTRPLYGATFGQAIQRFFKQYANFNGRASRSEYWWVALFVFLVTLIPGLLYILSLVMIGESTDYDEYTGYSSGFTGGSIALLIISGLLLFVVGIGLLVPQLALGWRRLHDANYPGPLYLLNLVPYVGWIIAYIFALMPSKAQGRRFQVPTV